MTTERQQRGHPFPDGLIHKEAQKLVPYPIWDAWNFTVKKHFKEDWEKLENGGQAILKEAYNLRRGIQLGRKTLDHWLEFISRIDKDHPGFLDEQNQILNFIVEKTEPNGVRGKAYRPRRR